METGLPLLVKQAARRIAGWRGIGDYPGTSPYSWREYCTSVFAGSRPHLVRPVYGERMPFHDHKGFNWMALRDRLARRFDPPSSRRRFHGLALTWRRKSGSSRGNRSWRAILPYNPIAELQN